MDDTHDPRAPVPYRGTCVCCDQPLSSTRSAAAAVGLLTEQVTVMVCTHAPGLSCALCRYTLFPRLRAVADLLMMPKEVLTDRHIRAEVVPGLSLRHICALLGRFHPDDFAAEPLPAGMQLHGGICTMTIAVHGLGTGSHGDARTEPVPHLCPAGPLPP